MAIKSDTPSHSNLIKKKKSQHKISWQSTATFPTEMSFNFEMKLYTAKKIKNYNNSIYFRLYNKYQHI